MRNLQLKEKLKALIRTGFFFVIVSQVIAKLVGFANSIILARLLTKEDYGFYTYAANIISVCLLLDGVGTISAILQFGSAEPNPLKKNAYSRFGFIIGQSFNAALSIGILLYALFAPLSIADARILLIIMAFQPIFSYAISYFSTNLRARMFTKSFSVMNIVVTALSLVAMVIGGVLYDAVGVAVATYIAYIVGIVIYIVVFRKQKIKILDGSVALESREKKNFLKMSFSATCNDAILHLVMVADLFLIGTMIADPTVSASYKIATAIPSALVFVPSSIMVYAFPYFAKHQNDLKWVIKHYVYLIGAMLVIDGLIVLLCYILAPWLITGIYGNQYADSVPFFRILMLGFFFNGTFRTPTVNVLWSQRKNLSVVIQACIMGAVNIIMDIILIKNFQAIGAAYATLLTYFVAAVVSVGLFVIHCLRRRKAVIGETPPPEQSEAEEGREVGSEEAKPTSPSTDGDTTEKSETEKEIPSTDDSNDNLSEDN